MKVSIVIPCYNEEENVKRLIGHLRELTDYAQQLEVILVQNGSKDRTAELLHSETESVDWMSVVEVPVNRGYGYGIRQGLKRATGDYLGWMHADLQVSAKEIVTALAQLQRLGWPEQVLLKGRRTNRPLVDTLFTLGMSCYETLLLGCRMYDINAQPTILSRDLYRQWDSHAPDDFSLDLYAYCMAVRCGAKLVRWKVCQHQRVGGSSSWNTGMGARWKLVRRTISFSRQLQRNLGRGKAGV